MSPPSAEIGAKKLPVAAENLWSDECLTVTWGDPVGPLKVTMEFIHMAMSQNLGYTIMVGKWIYSK